MDGIRIFLDDDELPLVVIDTSERPSYTNKFNGEYR